MKNLFAQLLGNPKVVLPVALILAIIIGVVFSGSIGRAPTVDFLNGSDRATSTAESTSNSTDLAFSKTGHLAAVNITSGDYVQAGEILASLDAGDALGIVNQARGALELAKAQYASLSVQYNNTKKQQDTLVANAYRTLLTSDLAAVARKTENEDPTTLIDNSQTPQISGTYTCGQEGSYEVDPYASSVASGYSFFFKGLESGMGSVTYYTPQPLGSCGLFIQFPAGYSATQLKWVINIPNTQSSNYAANKNAYDLAVATRDQILKQFEANLGKDQSVNANVAQAAVDAARGAYEAAIAAYQSNLIIAPIDGVVTFVDSHLKIGQTINANRTVITVTKK